MVAERHPCEPTDVAILRKPLKFLSGPTARNRIVKAGLSEMIAPICPENMKEHGLPTETIINMYQKWGEWRIRAVDHGKYRCRSAPPGGAWQYCGVEGE
ncbi:unnamed protein product, partial [Mesorhabditis spiculigera]